MLDALISGVAQGQSADQISRLMAEGTGLGLDRSLLIARTEINRAYRAGATEQYRESGVTIGFMRLVARDEACLACIALDGEKFETADEMDDHPNGRCTVVPIINGEPPPTWERAQDWFAAQPESRQLEIMGPTRLEMYKAGMPIESFAGKAHSDEWGDSPRIIPLKELEAGGAGIAGDEVSNIVDELSDDIRNEPLENRYIIDSRTGEIISSGVGDATSVEVQDTTHVTMPRHTVIDLHNHPEGSPPSDGDWKQLGWSSIKELKVVTQEENFTLIPPENFRMNPKQIKEVWDVIENNYFANIYKSSDEAYDIILYINKEMAKETGVAFIRSAK